MNTTTRLVMLFTVALLAAPARAHEVRPAFLELTERPAQPGVFDVLWKVPVMGDGVPLAGEDTPHEKDAPLVDPATAPQTAPCGCPTPWATGRTFGALPIHAGLPAHAK